MLHIFYLDNGLLYFKYHIKYKQHLYYFWYLLQCVLFLIIVCMYDKCAWVQMCHGIRVAVRGQLSGVSDCLPPIHEIQGYSSGHQMCTACTFTHLAILPVPCFYYFTYCIKSYEDKMWYYVKLLTCIKGAGVETLHWWI